MDLQRAMPVEKRGRVTWLRPFNLRFQTLTKMCSLAKTSYKKCCKTFLKTGTSPNHSYQILMNILTLKMPRFDHEPTLFYGHNKWYIFSVFMVWFLQLACVEDQHLFIGIINNQVWSSEQLWKCWFDATVKTAAIFCSEKGGLDCLSWHQIRSISSSCSVNEP